MNKPERITISFSDIALIGIFFLIASRVAMDADTWWHLRAGKWMVEHRQILVSDVFSHTRAGAPWEITGYWVEALMYLVYRTFGLVGLNVWVALTMPAIFFFVNRTLRAARS